MKNSHGKSSVYVIFLMAGIILGAFAAGAGLFETITQSAPFRAIFNNTAPAGSEEARVHAADSMPPAARPQASGINGRLSVSRRNAIVEATRRVSPCVVGIVVTQLQVVRRYYSYNDFFDFFFGPDFTTRLREVEKMGSGFVFREDGYILTNHHVVEGASKLYVNFTDGRQIEGKPVGSDPWSDLAVIKVPGDGYKCVSFGDSRDLMIGEWAIAIGNPFGYFINDAHPTVTVGVISAMNRNFSAAENVYYRGMIQTDAAINPGNSGGPLLNALGHVIGINAFIYTGDQKNRGSIGIGFAIPANRARRMARELIAFGRRRTIWQDFSVENLTRSTALALGYEYTDGVIVTDVRRGGAAAAAGLKRYDIITRIGRQNIRLKKDIEAVMLDYFVGDRVKFTVIRKSKKTSLTIKLREYPKRK